MKWLTLLLVMTASIALADTSVGIGTFRSSDSDGAVVRSTVTSVTGSVTENTTIGLSHSHLNYSSKGWSERGYRDSFVVTYQQGDTTMLADLGFTSIGGNVRSSGSIYGEHQVSLNTIVYAGIERHLLDNQAGVTNGIYYNSAAIGVDWSNDLWGLTGVYGETRFSDRNTRRYTKAKGYYTVVDGVHVYVRNYHYENSSPFTGNYFAPRRYNQTLVGVGFRYQIGPGLFIGHVDHGAQHIDGKRSPSHTWRISYAISPDKTNGPLSVMAFIGADRNQPGYTYRSSGIAISYMF